ncbi:hypothetical protein PENARI_c001G01018 [Penicillium arizonense]|uniref:Uncharacterized protein n=1 Tax=Penicillium arizonense TaxID=1835702 RepID=A0A1F5LZM6_PENAI|nr:hypothetical protein PENARI_c001G01018 [Penicillium arizonense]OGE58536.1 hypothetical protein PENARI_c001G01018 [Penicillium arizonense]
MWGVSVPQLAFEYEPLLHALLALGAAHRATLLPQEVSSLRPVYHGYFDSAIRRHRPVTANLDKNVTEAVCMNTVLLHIRPLPPIVYDQLITNNSPLCPLLLAQPAIWKSADRTQRVYNGPMKPLQFLLHYRQEDDRMDSAAFAVYEEGVAYLERFYIDVQKGQPDHVLRRMFSGFPPVVPRTFIGFVAERRPPALVILAYLCALVKEFEDICWLPGIPEREVQGISSIIPV